MTSPTTTSGRSRSGSGSSHADALPRRRTRRGRRAGAPREADSRQPRRTPEGSSAAPGGHPETGKRCIRKGCPRFVPKRKQHHDACSFICSAIAREMEMAQRVCAATGDTELWTATEDLNTAFTAYFRSNRRVYDAAREVGITDQQWRAIKDGTATG